MKPLVLTVTLLLPFVLGIAPQEDDIVFDDVAEETSSITPVIHRKEHETPRIHSETKKHRVERFWGVPDSTVTVGHVFKLKIPKQAFGGSVDHYKVRSGNDKPLPRWIYWDDAASTFLGVPTKKDVGQHEITVKAHGKHGDVATDSFTLRVKPEKFDELKHKDGTTHCNEGEEQTLLTIIVDSKFDDLKPATKVEAIENLAGFLGLHTSSFSMHPQSVKEGTGSQDSSVILTGPGNVKHRKVKHSTSIQWQVGCEGRLWRHQADLLKQLREQARDGTLAEVLQLPVLLWRVKTDASSLLRSRREIGSGDYGNGDDNDEEYDENDDDYYDEAYDDGERDDGEDAESITEIPARAIVPHISASQDNEADSEQHPHRHHHGEETIPWKPIEDIDEHDIVPIVNQRLGSVSNVSSSTPVASATTTSQAASSSPTSASSSATTTPTSTTYETPISPVITQSISTSKSQVPISMSVGTTTVSMPSSTSPASTATTYGPVTIASTTETTKSDTSEELAERTNLIDTDTDTVPSTSLPTENITTTPVPPPPFTSTPQTASTIVTTLGMTIPTSSERTDSKFTSAVYVNITEEEPTEITELPTTTQNPITTTVPITVVTTPTTTTTMTTTTTTTEMPTVATTIPTSAPETTQITTITTTRRTTTTIPTTSTMTTTTSEMPRTMPPTTEKIEYGVRNFPPRTDKRVKKLPNPAGKPLRYIIPADTFSDVEDGDTRKLKLALYLQGVPVKNSHWLQLNSENQELYGLPLEDHVSKWDHELVAFDSEGLNATEKLDIYVQQHKTSRSANHEFSIYLTIDKRTAFPTNVDWELKVVHNLAQLYGDSDPSEITVRSIEITEPNQAIFTWTNDSIPRDNECPKDEINKLLHVLIADKHGDPSALLMQALSPEIRVKRVVYQGLGQCEEAQIRGGVETGSTLEPKLNRPPMLRNPVDQINATVGQLLVFKVPHDTFYDHEDGAADKLRMALLTNDRRPIPPNNWLQFDVKNHEFYGVPLHGDVGRKEYQLIVTDKDGATSTDGMVVIVEAAPIMRHSVEFSMTLDYPYENFGPLQKKQFIEKVRDLFEDKDTSAISLDSVTEGSTIVTWRNTTLPTDHCPNDEIARLSKVLVKPDRSLTDRIEKIMGEKSVKQITLTPMGMCLGQLPGVNSPDNRSPPSGDSTAVGTSNDDILITYVLPAIIVAAMLILAGIIACVFYRRRRSGKMSVSEQDDERQSFRSKGIPVIFQDELDEKPDPGNKSPVILKEEKPPLPPPEYQKAEDGADVPMLSNENSEEPYQPPPPFATNRDNNRQNRPKPTPTYRKPPPYVPP